MSSSTELVIFLAVIAAAWIAYVVRQVLRDRRKPSLPATVDAYEGNLIIPAAGMRRHGEHSGIGHSSSAAGHMGAHHGPGGFDVHGPFAGGHHH
jgi:hypothetical protein